MLPVVPPSFLAAARSWSSVTVLTSAALGLLCPPNQPPPIPEVSDDMLLQPPSTPSSAATMAHRSRQTMVLRANCVTTPLSEHLPGLSRTGIPYPVEPTLTPSGYCPANQSLAPGKPADQAQANET